MKNLQSRFSKQIIRLITRTIIFFVTLGFFAPAAFSQITSTIPASRCGEGPLVLRASATTGTIKWYDVPFYGSPVGTGTSFTTPSLIVTKTYYVDAVDASNCSLNPGNSRVQVIAAVSANSVQSVIFYSSNTFCKSVAGTQSITHSGTSGGVYTVIPTTGLTLNSSTGDIVPATSSTGTYTVTYTVVAAEGCSENPASTDVTITTIPLAPVITYTGSPYCTTASPVNVSQTGAAGGTYSASPSGLTINAAGGTITPATSQAGIYTVTYFVPGSGGCAPQTATASVSINTASVGGTATAEYSPISAGTGTTISLTGYNGAIQWQSSNDNISFSNISGQTASTLSTGVLSATTYYRAIVTNGICSLAASSTATVVVNAVSVAGTAASAQSICYGFTANLTLSGYTGNIQWQTNASGSFVDINGATSASYTTPALTTTTSYQAVVTNGVSAPANSNPVQVTVIPASVGGSINGTTICSGTSTELSLSEYIGTIQWQSNASGSFTDIEGATSATYTTPALTATTSYKAIVTSAPCSSVESTVAIVTVDPVSVGGTANANPSTICSGGATTITLSAYTGTIQWQTNASGSFADIKGETNTTYTTPSLTATTIYRAIVTNGVCSSSTSTDATVSVVDDPSISEQPAVTTSECIGGAVQLSVTAGNGTPLLTYQWYSNTSASTSGSTLLTGETASTYTPPATDAGTTYYYAVISAAGNGCTSATSFFAEVIVNALPTPTFTTQPEATAFSNTDLTYTTESGKSGYIWTFPGTLNTDYTITSGGANTNSVTLKYLTAGSKTVTVNYMDNGCTAPSATSSVSTTVTLFIGDAIYNALSTSQASYNAAADNSLVKITSSEYETIVTNLSATRTGYTGSLDNSWATRYTANSTFSYNSNGNPLTTTTFDASNWAVAVSFIPALNPQGLFSCQLKYNLSNTLYDMTSVYDGATVAVLDRQYFAIKKPSVQLPGSSPFISFYSSCGIATNWTNGYFDYKNGNLSGAVSGWSTITDSPNAVPTIQVLQTVTKQW